MFSKRCTTASEPRVPVYGKRGGGRGGSVARCVIEPVDHRVRAPGACVQNRCDCACGVPVHSGVPSECKLQSAPDKWGYTPGHCYANGMRRVTLQLCHLCHVCHPQSVALHRCHLCHPQGSCTSARARWRLELKMRKKCARRFKNDEMMSKSPHPGRLLPRCRRRCRPPRDRAPAAG